MQLTIRQPDDFHIHLRQDASLPLFARDCLPWFGRVLVMPNTLPPLNTPDTLTAYKHALIKAAPELLPLLTFKISTHLTPQDVYALKAAGAYAGKIYPEGVTTHSEDGVSSVKALEPILSALEDSNLVLCVHAEQPGAFSLDREAAYLPQVEWILQKFPKLRVVLEHISDARSAKMVAQGPVQLAATLTVHHLALTLDDVIGGFLSPHHFCKPIPKRPQDLQALWDLVAQKHPRVFLGTDSAPHARGKKECAQGCAGVYSAPVAIPLLAQLFEEKNLLPHLENFTSVYGAQFYQLPLNSKYIQLKNEPWEIPQEIHGCVPFRAGLTCNWKLFTQ